MHIVLKQTGRYLRVTGLSVVYALTATILTGVAIGICAFGWDALASLSDRETYSSVETLAGVLFPALLMLTLIAGVATGIAAALKCERTACGLLLLTKVLGVLLLGVGFCEVLILLTQLHQPRACCLGRIG